MTKLQTLYNAYKEIETVYDLQKYELTLAEYDMIPGIILELHVKGRARTWCEDVKKFFERFGFNVTTDRFNRYVIVNE